MIGVFRSFRWFLRPYRRVFVIGAILAICEVLFKLLEPWPLTFVVDKVLRPGTDAVDNPTRLLAFAALSLIAIVAVIAAFNYWSTRILASAGLQLANDIRESVFTHLQRLSLRYHGQQQVGDVASRVTSDVDRVQDMIVQTLSVVAPNMLLVLGMFSVMVMLDAPFALLAIALTPLLAVAIRRSSRSLRLANRVARKADGQVAAATNEGLSAIHLVQAFSLENEQRERFTDLNDTSLRAGLETVRLQARVGPLVDVASAVSTVLVIWFGANRVLDKKLSLGVLLAFLAYLTSLYKPIKALTKLSNVIGKGVSSAERVNAVLQEAPDIRDTSRSVRAPRLRGSIGFENVSHSYGREQVLSDLTLQIGAGETVALVGPTGAGKSTLASLIPRFVDPSAGIVTLDRNDVRNFTVSSVRSQIALVLQECVLLRGTLRDNIAVGNPGAPDAEIERAARLALVDEFSWRLPDGLDTPIGERGVNLSGGQRQRIAIARAILRDAPIMILDEPTSALDTASEELIVEALRNLPAGRTTVLIAHRLSTVRRADRIAVLQNGRLVQLGTQPELASVDGLYRSLLLASSAGPNQNNLQLPLRMPGA